MGIARPAGSNHKSQLTAPSQLLDGRGCLALSRSSSSDKGQDINPHYPHLHHGGNFAEQVVQRIQSSMGRGLVSPAHLVTG